MYWSHPVEKFAGNLDVNLSLRWFYAVRIQLILGAYVELYVVTRFAVEKLQEENSIDVIYYEDIIWKSSSMLIMKPVYNIKQVQWDFALFIVGNIKDIG